MTGHTTTQIVLDHYFQPGREEFRTALMGAMPAVLSGEAAKPPVSSGQLAVGSWQWGRGRAMGGGGVEGDEAELEEAGLDGAAGAAVGGGEVGDGGSSSSASSSSSGAVASAV